MEERLSASGGEVLAGIRSGVATVTLNRPKSLNALTLGMVEALGEWLDAWATDPRVRIVFMRGAGDKAFCAGGDIRWLHDTWKADGNVGRFFKVEYDVDHRIHTYNKPVVALLDGVVMGGGMGLAQGARLRLVGERTRMAMPETGIGCVPDVGGSYFLSRLEGVLGRYLALVGPTLGPADAIYSGLADQYIGSTPMPPGELAALMPAIDAHFGKPTVDEIVASLEAERSAARLEWARATLDAMSRRSPTMLKVTLEQLDRGGRLGLRECFEMERGLMRAAFEHGDYLEGIRALIIDKDKQPRWKPASLDEVDPGSVARFFSTRP
jgi:enoyl-CoA hydratase/carnithine racemase